MSSSAVFQKVGEFVSFPQKDFAKFRNFILVTYLFLLFYFEQIEGYKENRN